jgi:2-phospho-L-lactate/phosphoenolpyruvate guanylyltransferase
MRTAAVLPVKRFSEAKQRLGASVEDPLRRDLVRAMVGDVLSALGECRSVTLTIVVTNEQSVAEAARSLGATVVEDSAERGQSAAVALGVNHALAVGLERALCIPGDCPALDPAELSELLDGAAAAAEPDGDAAHIASRGASSREEREVVIVPDRHGTGTNGLLLCPPDAIAPSFGPGSCERHIELARTAGVRSRIARPGSLLLDIDTGADLAALRERLAGERTRALRTREVLGLAAEPWSQPALTAR